MATFRLGGTGWRAIAFPPQNRDELKSLGAMGGFNGPSGDFEIEAFKGSRTYACLTVNETETWFRWDGQPAITDFDDPQVVVLIDLLMEGLFHE